MIFAPHPDDESLACGILLQAAVSVGAAARIVYLTDGENNPWPQRFLARRWRLDLNDRERWAKLRRREAVAALGVLGVARAEAQFLGWPDQGLSALLRSDRASSLARLRNLIREWGPTDLFVPDVADRHRDHKAVGLMFQSLFLSAPESVSEIEQWSYLVHGLPPAFRRQAHALAQTPLQADTKRRAISCHKTQLKLSRRRFLQYADRPELFRNITPPRALAESPPLTRPVELVEAALSAAAIHPYAAAND
ncbi:MAG: PIG-L family deacetylase [Chthoniobacterales bacterium]